MPAQPKPHTRSALGRRVRTGLLGFHWSRKLSAAQEPGRSWLGRWPEPAPAFRARWQGTTYSSPAVLGEPGLGDPTPVGEPGAGQPARDVQEGRGGGRPGKAVAGQARRARARPLLEDGQAVRPGALACGCLASTHYALLSAGPQGTPGQPIPGLLLTMEGVGQVEAWG